MSDNPIINIFAQANEAKLPKLTKQQLTKLKQLSIVSMAAENRVRRVRQAPRHHSDCC
jgi:hypothetical protein